MRYGLIGEKLGHSYSKPIHEKLAPYQYDIIPLTKEEFHLFMKKKEFTAINVTIPYKQAVIPYLAKLDAHAKTIGAVNTIVNRGGVLTGYNTDFFGFLYMIEQNNIQIEGKKTLIIGNGGAAQAILAAVNYLKAKEILIVDIHKAEGVLTYEECKRLHSDIQVIINTSPVGMFPNVNDSPIDLTGFSKCEAVLDIIYNPIETKLVKQALTLGMKATTGLEMLVAQAKYAAAIFLDKEIDDSVIEPIYKDLLQSFQ